MANNGNVSILVGNLGKDPEMRYTDNGTAITNFSLPVETGWGDNTNTEWVRISVFGKEAERCHEYLHKGSSVLVVAEMDKPWVNDSGKATLQYRAIKVTFLARFGKQVNNQQSEPDDDMPF